MKLTDEVKSIDSSTATIIAVFFLCFVAPGALIIFHFEREMFIGLETFKLLLLSISLSAPGFFVPYFITFITTRVLQHQKVIVKDQLGSSSSWYRVHGVNNAINLYLILFVSYVFSLEFIHFAWIYFAFIVAISAFEMWSKVRLAFNPDKVVPLE
ncbi:MAG: hypothetical protein GY820_19160 [Gammaproteobacteria bacterium]|nr:hypothetical protein [Gammaproteobacteria bacterium]